MDMNHLDCDSIKITRMYSKSAMISLDAKKITYLIKIENHTFCWIKKSMMRSDSLCPFLITPNNLNSTQGSLITNSLMTYMY